MVVVVVAHESSHKSSRSSEIIVPIKDNLVQASAKTGCLLISKFMGSGHDIPGSKACKLKPIPNLQFQRASVSYRSYLNSVRLCFQSPHCAAGQGGQCCPRQADVGVQSHSEAFL